MFVLAFLKFNLALTVNVLLPFSLVVEDIYWNGNDLNNYPLPQGIYIYKLHVNNLVNGKKVTVHNKVFKKL